LLLTEYCEDLELFFKKGEELDWFKTPQECYDKITFYLNNPKKREQIAKRGKKKAFEKFTWEKQIENILNFVSR
jgi:spore maturation protein CgeB